ncbi:hypothetical protein LGL08_20380 [Clostridium estertheticum]|uniref:hypothetical protein n=1 Tax=Clostridium estertheticum TaxID=238834 RepID=UPI001CF1B2C1|nr:hypothetical protein [Clostridium estertheticum]MCB2308861.1 hypothetical protein [Clostridium estertheticum]MCB2347273.1 hypothetical protein [Clostridium estertheticum]MCB2351886.1 hypothetical protein [Clostridium estertheticum]WAG48476.1 hypothetical protein LL127_23425 [Clostridium estertheticum]
MTAENKEKFMAYVHKAFEEKRIKEKANDADVNDYNNAKTWRFRKIRGHRG